MKVNFVLTGEGPSDRNLADHIESILIEEGFEEVSGSAPDLGLLPNPVGRSVRDKLNVILHLYPNVDAIFVHRDADRAGVDARRKEIFDAADGLIHVNKVIPIIPVTEFETWLLTDRDAIKRVAGNVGYGGALSCIPALRNLEGVHGAKEVLLEALCEASETQGARLRRFKNQFPEMRARLTFDLDPNGPVRNLVSYQKFRKSISDFARSLLY
ncbi:DUF4276 family protein [Burkholderia cenocepacia]|uniref:DUF4276 family protein n=1 Tax=Burkholderia cenocepacia TaxID=95486 RepID=UPI00209EA536|nr:DUF4276 family protein [Burkholderia cenocepacia]MCO8321750.1 hypothetical protein [Burkholderia cenocepacia]MCO8329034.1 hypothetical protein [Burkholderia cenocepacia]MCO8336320.1 hypothetical protein [Burkholderia cenocepacia]MCO8343605.1 hypothetical protein [Burkholderia cenocepacia]MCO8356887.1 hypothetical protein [Burkholderia cenocepacia]